MIYRVSIEEESVSQSTFSLSKNFEEFEIKQEDERLTSDTAEENLRNRKINFRKEKGLVDVESARIILEQYLKKIN